MTRRSDIGTAVIGSGFIGTVHIEALRRIGVNVTGCSAPRATARAARAEQVDVGRAYALLDELLDDDRVDVVHVTSPQRAPLPAGQGDPRGGPARRVREAAGDDRATSRPSSSAWPRASGLVNAVNFNIRFYPLNQHVRGVRRATAGWGTSGWSPGATSRTGCCYDTDWNWRLEPERGGALRAVGDIGSHWLDLTTFVTGQRVAGGDGRPDHVHPRPLPPTGPVETFSTERAADTVAVDIRTEDVATVLLRFENGARGQFAVSQLSPGRKNSLQYEIDGSSSAVAWDSERPEQLWIGHRDRPNELLLRNPALMNALGGRPRRGCRAATSRDSSTRSAPCSWPSTRTSPRVGRPPRPLSDVRGRTRRDAGRRRDRRERAHRRLGRRGPRRGPRGRVRRFSAMIRRRAGNDMEGSPR